MTHAPIPPGTPKAAGQPAWWHNAWIVGLLLFCCAPIGLVLLWLNPNWSTKNKGIVTAVVAGLVVIGLATGATNSPTTDSSDSPGISAEKSAPAEDEEPQDEPKPEPKPEPKVTKAPQAPQTASVTTTASQMVQEFQDNELAADAKYKDKWVEVSGVVDKVDTEIWNSNKYVLNIGGGSDFEILTVNCHDIPKSELAKVSKGDDVTVVGEFKDGGDLGVELKKCRLS